MNRLFFIFFFTCFLLTGSFAQKNSTIDSLINLIKIAKEDSSKVLLLIRAGQEFESDHQDIAKEYYQQAKKLSENIHYLRGILKFISNYTYILNTENKIDSSIELNLLGVKLAREINDREYLGKSLVNTGMSYFNNQDYELAFKYVNEGRTILEKLFDESDIAIIYDQLQVICLGLKQYDRAITYGKKAVSLFEKTDNKYGLTTALNNLGTIYDRKMQYNLAEEYFKKAYKLAVRENDLLLESTVLLNLTDIDIKLFRLDELPSKVKRILEISNQINIPVNKAIALRALGIYYLNKMNFKESYKYLDSSLKLAKIAGSREHTRKALEVQSNLFYAMHDFKKAENILSISDSIAMTEINENIHKITLDLEKKYETEKNLATIELQKSKLRNRRNLNFIFGGTAVALAVISLLLFFNYKQSQRIQKQKIIELENQKNLQSTKAVLKGEEQERSRLAKDLQDGLSGMLSGVKYSLQDMKGNLILTEENQLAFERSMDMLDSSIKELRRVAHNMMPEVLVRYGLDSALKDYIAEINKAGMLKVVYQSMGMEDRQIENASSIVIYRIVQELLNNVIKHASASEALVQILGNNDKIIVNVEDNGIGFDIKRTEEKGGMGWKNIRSRVELLNGTIDVQSTESEGTAVNIEFNKI